MRAGSGKKLIVALGLLGVAVGSMVIREPTTSDSIAK